MSARPLRMALSRAVRWIADKVESFSWALHDLAELIYGEVEQNAHFDDMTSELRIAIDRLGARIEARSSGVEIDLPPMFERSDATIRREDDPGSKNT